MGIHVGTYDGSDVGISVGTFEGNDVGELVGDDAELTMVKRQSNNIINSTYT